MPGPYIHIAAARAIEKHLREIGSWEKLPIELQLPAMPGPSPADLAQLASDFPNYYALGAIGPDLFFFLADFRGPGAGAPLSNTLLGVIRFLDDFYAKLDEYFLKYKEEYFDPIAQSVDETISRLSGDLVGAVSRIVGELVTIGVMALEDLATQSRDWFGGFYLRTNAGDDNKNFTWSDMLHYRKTSHFGMELWRSADDVVRMLKDDGASDDEAEKIGRKVRAYAVGYITHLGTDVTGHPFVNEKAGGPFRSHWQRHHLVENHMDARTYDDDHGMDDRYDMLAESALHWDIVFGDDEARALAGRPDYPLGNTMSDLFHRKRVLDIDSELPDELANGILGALEKTFNCTGSSTSDLRPTESTPQIILGNDGKPTLDELKDTYLILFRYLKFVTLDGFAADKPSPPDVFPNLDFPDPADFFGGPPGPNDPPPDLWDILLAILKCLLWLFAVALWLATVIPGAIADLGTYGPRLIAYYTLELPLYQIIKAERAIMVMTGYLMPLKDEIDIGLVRLCTGSQNLFLGTLKTMDDAIANLEAAALAALQGNYDAAIADVLAAGGDGQALVTSLLGDADMLLHGASERVPDPAYPHSIAIDADHHANEFTHPWDYPTSPTELSPTFAGPHACGELPHVLLDNASPGSQRFRVSAERAHRPEDTDKLNSTVTAVNNLGDPVNFGSYLLWQLTRVDFIASNVTRVTDWNLDSDRGYAYKCWDWNRFDAPPEGSDAHVLLDENHHQVLETCVKPQQTPRDSVLDPTQRLELHYTDDPNPPHCDDDARDA
jgi:hypothetical protein